MIHTRSLIYFVLMALSIIIYGLPLSLVALLIPIPARNRLANNWARVNLFLLKHTCGLDYRVQGKEHLPDGAAIIMSKHQSTWETISLRHIIGGKQSWVLKRELMWVPIFGWAMFFMSPIAINRKAGRKAVKQVVTQGTDYLDKGHRIIIFPEGTRTPFGSHGRYGVGGALLAEHSGHAVIPVAHNAGLFWARRGITKHPGTIDVVIGEPIETQGKSAKQIIREVEAWIESTMKTLPSTRQQEQPE